MNKTAKTIDTVRERERELHFNEINTNFIKIENKKIVVKA